MQFQDSNCRTAKNLVRLGLGIRGGGIVGLRSTTLMNDVNKDHTWEEIINI